MGRGEGSLERHGRKERGMEKGVKGAQRGCRIAGGRGQCNTWGVGAVRGGEAVWGFGRKSGDGRGGGAGVQKGGLPEQFMSVREQSWGGSFSV